MKISKIAVLCLLTSVLWQGARAQWIIDGQQVQTLNLNVSDPQALYTDGSREMTAPLVFSEACSAPTSSIFQITVPWLGGVKEFFVFDASSEYLKLCDGPLNLEVGGLVLSSAGIYSMEFPGSLNFEEGVLEFGEEANISTEEGTLDGNWYVTGVAEDSSSIINRGYADSRYLRSDSDLTAPLSFSSASTATSGLFRAYNEWNGEVENLLIYDADNELIKLGDLTTGLQIGSLKVEQYKISQPGTGHTISFEEGLLLGSWGVFSNPDTEYGIVSRGYADTRYLRSDTPLTNSLLTSVTNAPLIKMSTGAGFLKPYGNKIEFTDDQTKYLFFVEGDSGNDTGMRVRPSGIYRHEEDSIVRAVEMDTGTLYGKWYLTDVDEDEDYTMIHRLYADGRYLQRTEGITTNHTFQAGDVLVIQNGLITAINP